MSGIEETRGGDHWLTPAITYNTAGQHDLATRVVLAAAAAGATTDEIALPDIKTAEKSPGIIGEQ